MLGIVLFMANIFFGEYKFDSDKIRSHFDSTPDVFDKGDTISDGFIDAIQQFEFPANRYPAKITSFNLDKNPVVEGCLDAIKGQYLIMDTGVINIRKFAGYLVSLEAQ